MPKFKDQIGSIDKWYFAVNRVRAPFVERKVATGQQPQRTNIRPSKQLDGIGQVLWKMYVYVVANVQIQLMYTLADRLANEYISWTSS